MSSDSALKAMTTGLEDVSRLNDQVTNAGVSEKNEQVAPLEVGLLTGGVDRPYALGLASALLSRGVRLEFIGSDDLDSPQLRLEPQFTFLNLSGDQSESAGVVTKVWRVLRYYARLIRYAWCARPRVFHILWNNKFDVFDRIALMLYYKLLGRKVVLTAHNVNAGKRDSHDSLINRLSLGVQYRLADHIFVHTETMKRELCDEFDVAPGVVSVISFGLNNSVADTELTTRQAKQSLGIGNDDRTILFFGHIGPYKGLEFLVTAFQQLAADQHNYRLIIAGKSDPGCEGYWREVEQAIRDDSSCDRVIQRIEFVPDAETEVYFKAADVLVLPYTHVSQSGVLRTGYRFGLPAIASDVGSFREDIIEGRTGLLCKPGDPVDLARVIAEYFRSDLFKELTTRRKEIREYADSHYSWDAVSRVTRTVYQELLGR